MIAWPRRNGKTTIINELRKAHDMKNQNEAQSLESVLTALQDRIGQGNADRGFHASTLRIMGNHSKALNIARSQARENGGVMPREAAKELELAEHTLRTEVISKLALIVTEAAEAIEEVRNGESLTKNYYTISGERVHREYELETEGSIWVSDDGLAAWSIDIPAKPEGLPSEVADIVIRCIDLAFLLSFPLFDVVDEKLDYNDTRQALHGKKL